MIGAIYPLTPNLYHDYEFANPMDGIPLQYLMKRSLLISSQSGANAPFDNLFWTLILISILTISITLYSVVKMRLVSIRIY